jgi:hypothetical protein
MDKKCLRAEEIIDYLKKRLPGKARTRAEQHLSECDECLEEAIIAMGVVRGGDLAECDPVPAEVTRKAIKAVQKSRQRSLPEELSRFINKTKVELNRLMHQTLPIQGFSLAPVRGKRTVVSDDLIRIKKSFSGFDAEIEIEKTGVNKARIEVMVEGKIADSPIRVSLFRSERELFSYLTNGTNALFEDIPFAEYVLTFTRDGSKIGEYLFEIKESRHGRK